MIILARKLNQKIFIGDNITVTVHEITRGKVRLAIEAPRDQLILREELVFKGKEKGEEPEGPDGD